MSFQFFLTKLMHQQNLSSVEMTDVMQSIMQSIFSPAQIAALLIALEMKGPAIPEITAAAALLRKLALPVPVKANHLVDIVGTGGDQAKLFNVSTTSAFVAAAAGAHVAKHNNRAISSHSGSADVLLHAGISLQLSPTQIATCIEKIGVGFMFAPQHHHTWQQVSAVRRELGVRTLFNLLGPLVNPAHVPNLLVGVFAEKYVAMFAEVFKLLGNQQVMVVHSQDGLDEISIAAPTLVAELKNGDIKTYTITPQQFGFTSQSLDTLRVTNAEESFNLMLKVLKNQPCAALDIVTLNAGAAIYVAQCAPDLASGVILAKEMIANGRALAKFLALRELTQSFCK